MSRLSDEELPSSGVYGVSNSTHLQDHGRLEFQKGLNTGGLVWPLNHRETRPFTSSLIRVVAALLTSLAAAYLVLRCFQGLSVAYRQNETNRALAAGGDDREEQCYGEDNEEEEPWVSNYPETKELPEAWNADLGCFTEEIEGGESVSVEVFSSEGWDNREMPPRAEIIFGHYLGRIEAAVSLCMELKHMMTRQHYFLLANRISMILVTQLGVLSLNPPSLEPLRERAGNALLKMLEDVRGLPDDSYETRRIGNKNKSLTTLVKATMMPREDSTEMTAGHHQKRVIATFRMLRVINGHLMGIISALRCLINYPEDHMPSAEIERQLNLLNILFDMQRDRITMDTTTFWFLLQAQKKMSQYLIFTRRQAYANVEANIPPLSVFEAELDAAIKSAGGIPYVPLAQANSAGKSSEALSETNEAALPAGAISVASRSSLRASAAPFVPQLQSPMIITSGPPSGSPAAMGHSSLNTPLQHGTLSGRENPFHPLSTDNETLGTHSIPSAPVPWSTADEENQPLYTQPPVFPTDQGLSRTNTFAYTYREQLDSFAETTGSWSSPSSGGYFGERLEELPSTYGRRLPSWEASVSLTSRAAADASEDHGPRTQPRPFADTYRKHPASYPATPGSWSTPSSGGHFGEGLEGLPSSYGGHPPSWEASVSLTSRAAAEMSEDHEARAWPYQERHHSQTATQLGRLPHAIAGGRSWNRQGEVDSSSRARSQRLESLTEVSSTTHGVSSGKTESPSWDEAARSGFAPPLAAMDPDNFKNVWEPLQQTRTGTRPAVRPPGFEDTYPDMGRMSAAGAPLEPPPGFGAHFATRGSPMLRPRSPLHSQPRFRTETFLGGAVNRNLLLSPPSFQQRSFTSEAEPSPLSGISSGSSRGAFRHTSAPGDPFSGNAVSNGTTPTWLQPASQRFGSQSERIERTQHRSSSRGENDDDILKDLGKVTQRWMEMQITEEEPSDQS